MTVILHNRTKVPFRLKGGLVIAAGAHARVRDWLPDDIAQSWVRAKALEVEPVA